MKSLLTNKWLKSFGITATLMVIICFMTGPSGSNTDPVAGFSGSLFNSAPFLGLFITRRWVVFLLFALIAFVVQQGWQAYGRQVKVRYAKVMATPRELKSKRPVRLGTYGALLLLALLLPHLVTDPFWQVAMVQQIAVYVLLALGLNVVVGFAGLLDLGFVAFYAIGAYATAWVVGSLPLPPLFGHALNNFWAIPIAILIAMAAGIILGTPTLRLRGDYLAIVTLGFGEIITLFANNLNGITGGPQGSRIIPHFHLSLGPLKYVWGNGPIPYYYLILGFLILFLVGFSFLEHSRVGRTWTAIREDEVAAESLGINPLKYKVMAFAIGAASAGFSGVMTASQQNFVFPTTFSLFFSINILVLVIFGGLGSIRGVVFGAIVVQTITMYLLHSPPSGYQPADLYMYIGAMLVGMMIFRPAGLLPATRRKREIVQLREEAQ